MVGHVLIGIFASLCAGTATGIGAIPIFFRKEISEKFMDVALGFAAGVMLAASAFSLLVPALELETGGIWIVSAGFLSGCLFPNARLHLEILHPRHGENQAIMITPI
jgi:ZIP family zinc transporter